MESISTSTRKFIASLQQPKHRKREGLFVLEGTRAVLDTIPFFEVTHFVATAQWLEAHGAELPHGFAAVTVAKADDMGRMSSQSTPQGVLAVCRMKEYAEDFELRDGELLLALDRVQDPGNLGTIMRVADWFGVTRILASEDTVDVYNPKVIQASMGAVARVKVRYCDLVESLRGLGTMVPVYGTFLDGEDIYGTQLSRGGIIVMGNEGNGISLAVEAVVSRRIRIPTYPADRDAVESLNVSMAAGITLAEFRRRV